MRKFLILIAFVFCSAALYGQVDTVRLGYSVQGNVVDAVTGRPMESVHVSVPGRHYATVTNADGDFTIKSDQPVAEVTFSFLGYRTLRQKPGGGPLNGPCRKRPSSRATRGKSSGKPSTGSRKTIAGIPSCWNASTGKPSASGTGTSMSPKRSPGCTRRAMTARSIATGPRWRKAASC